MKTKKKTILQSIPLRVKLLAVFIMLSIGLAILGESATPVETGLWIFIGIVGISAAALVLVALVVSARNSKHKVVRNEHSEVKDKKVERKPPAPAPVATPHPPAHAGGHGHDSHGGASGALGWLLLVIVLGVLALVYVGKKAGFGVIPGVGGTSSTAHVSRIPVSACSVPPADAGVVLAPVDGCSRAYPVPSHSYGCADPGPSSGLVRVKSWDEGNPEPSSWDSGRARGNTRCFGSASSTPVTIRVWSEPQGSY